MTDRRGGHRLAFRGLDGWVIADYETGLGTDPGSPNQVGSYRRHVPLCAEAWTRPTGKPVEERGLVFAEQGRFEVW